MLSHVEIYRADYDAEILRVLEFPRRDELDNKLAEEPPYEGTFTWTASNEQFRH